MIQARDALVKLTGVDFGYDLKAWHEFLIENDEYIGYRHEYAYRSVTSAILKESNESRRIRLAKEIEADGDSGSNT